jgi:sterol desaturase/sphingolipid hydroxylase (fatty acid hydroxylase superfamily)
MSSEITSLTTFLEFHLTSWLTILSGEWATFTLLSVFVILLGLELSYPKRKLPFKKLGQSYQTNVSLFIVNGIIISLLSATPLLMLAAHYSDQGLLNYIPNLAWKAVLAFLLLDLIFYFWHKACHDFDCLWMFHKVHHNDPYLNVSTAFRIHIVELLIITVVKAVYIIVLGVNETMILTNETLSTLFVIFHHTNISFRSEKYWGQLIIVPYLHRVHHSTERNEHDSNYGMVFSIWDRLFGTLIEREPVKIGIKNRSPQTVFGLLKFGFTSENPAPVRKLGWNIELMIAEAAYYKAEKRAFAPGNELRDWLEAKREIIRMIYGDQSINKRGRMMGRGKSIVTNH